MAFVLVPRGKFWRGGGGGKPGTAEITIPYDFYLGKYEVTQEQWQAVMGFNPSHHSRQREGREEVQAVADEELKRFPVEFVSWVDVTAFLHLLNQQDATPGWRYCLPRAVEWEYACRGGPMADPAAGAFDFYLDQPGLRLDRLQANLGGALGRPCPVGRFPANPLGLHDMHGNVGEWCDDAGDWTWAPYNPADGIPTAPLPAEGPERKRPIDQAVRGGNWGRNADACRAGTWELLPTHTRDPRIGFRVARVYVGEEGSGTATGK
jgi:formylglycine-generating enzyme required for sulfatase activity